MQHFQIILASNNSHKKKEIAQALQTDILTPDDLLVKNFDPVEDATSFDGNAMLKAETLKQILKNQKHLQQKNIIIADDSGLCVQALNDEPGIFSARYANMQKNIHQNSSDEDNRKTLMQKLQEHGLWGSQAFFQCSIAYIIQDNHTAIRGIVSGKCHGIVAIKEVGNEGFGYDCMFYRDFEDNKEELKNKDFSLKNSTKEDALSNKNHPLYSLKHSLATLTLEQKTQISHRGQAILALQQTLKNI